MVRAEPQRAYYPHFYTLNTCVMTCYKCGKEGREMLKNPNQATQVGTGVGTEARQSTLVYTVGPCSDPWLSIAHGLASLWGWRAECCVEVLRADSYTDRETWLSCVPGEVGRDFANGPGLVVCLLSTLQKMHDM